jgi:hypothetical protein
MHKAIRNCKHAKVNLRRKTDDPGRGGKGGKIDFVFFIQVKSFVNKVTRVTQSSQFAWLEVCHRV